MANRKLFGATAANQAEDTSFFAGTVGGVFNDPIVNLLSSQFLSEENLARLQALGGEGLRGQAGRAVGELATQLVPGVKAFQVGQRAGGTALRAAARRFGTTGAVPLKGTQAGFGAAKKTNEAFLRAGVLARQRERLGQAGVRSELAQKGIISDAKGRVKSLDRALRDGDINQDLFERAVAGGVRRSNRSIGALGEVTSFERAFEIGGANLSLGLFEGARESARAIYEGDEFEEAARHAAFVTLLGIGLEGGLTALTRIPQFNVDLGLLKTLPLELQHKLGIVDDAGRTLTPGVGNPLFQVPELNQTARARISRRLREDVKRTTVLSQFAKGAKGERATVGVREEIKLAKESHRLFHEQFNRLASTGALEVADPTKVGRWGKVSFEQFKHIRNERDLKDLANLQIKVGRGTGTKAFATRQKKFQAIMAGAAKARNVERRFDAALRLNPMSAYVDISPGLTGGLETNLYREAMKFIITPEAAARRLGPAFDSWHQAVLRPLEEADIRIKDRAQSLAAEMKVEVATVLGLPKSTLIPSKMAKVNRAVIEVFDEYERFGRDRAATVARLVEVGRKGLSRDGDQLTQAEAEKIYDVFKRMTDIMEGGAVTEVMVQGQKVMMRDLEGFRNLIDEAPDIYRMLDQEGMARLVGKDAVFMPHLSWHFDSFQDMMDAYRKLLPKAQFDDIRNRINLRNQRDTLPMFSSLDFQRLLPGTLKDKLYTRGLPMVDDPFEAFSRYMYQTNHRLQYGRQFGFKHSEQREYVNFIQNLVRRNQRFPSRTASLAVERAKQANPEFIEHGPKVVETPNERVAVLAGDIIDIAMGHRWEDQAQRKLSSFLTSWNVASKLPLAVIPNMFQTTQTLAYNGIRNTWKGFLAQTNKETKKALLHGVGAVEGMIVDTGVTHSFSARPFTDPGFGSAAANALQQVADFTLGRPLLGVSFKRVEGFNRVVGGSASLMRATELIARTSGLTPAGRRTLIGRQLDHARRQARSMGFDLDEVVAKVQKAGVRTDEAGKTWMRWLDTPEGMTWTNRVVFRGAQQTQFIPSPLRKPLMWDHPWGRVVFQFKTFALQQYRFMRDTVMGELARGNIAPAATFMGIAPISGEIVGNIKDFLRDGQLDRGTNGIARYMQNVMYVGGAGILSDLIRAGHFEQMGEFIFGPTVGDIVGFGEQLTRLNIRGAARDVGRLPISQLSRTYAAGLYGLGSYSLDLAEEYFNETGDEPFGPTGKTISPGQLRQRRPQR